MLPKGLWTQQKSWKAIRAEMHTDAYMYYEMECITFTQQYCPSFLFYISTIKFEIWLLIKILQAISMAGLFVRIHLYEWISLELDIACILQGVVIFCFISDWLKFALASVLFS
jgi:hypothetical protein